LRFIFPQEIKGFEEGGIAPNSALTIKGPRANHYFMQRTLIITFMALLIWLSPIDGARTYIVDDSGFANYDTIQKAVAASSDGDTIFIKPGEYSEEVILNKSLIIKPLIGETDPIILNGEKNLETAINITADGCTLEGLTVKDYFGPAIYVQSNRNTIKNNIFENANPAILIRGANENSITRNKVTNSQGAIALWENSRGNLVQENDIKGCNVSILVREASADQIFSNRIYDTLRGIWLNEAGACQVEGNSIETRYFGIMLQNSSNTSLAENKVSFGIPDSDTLNGITISNSSEIDVKSNEINGGNLGLGIARSNNCKFLNNSIINSNYAVFIRNSNSDDFSKNTINDAKFAIGLEDLNGSVISQNAINNSIIGLQLTRCLQNNFSENQLSGMTDTALQTSSSNGNSFAGNMVKDCSRGFILANSSANRLQDNRFLNVMWSLYVDSDVREGFDNSIDESNVVDSSPIVYLFGRSGDMIQDRDIAHLTLAYCDNVTVKNTTIDNDAVFLYSSRDNRILDSSIISCFGIRLVQSDGNEISGNRLLDNGYSGLFLYASNSNQIAANNASHNSQNGIALLSCNENTIRDNVVDANAVTGIWLNLSNNNQIYQNNISNSPLGMDVMYCTGNRIFHNNFLGNTEHSLDREGNNSWDEGNVTGGNYWEGDVAKGNPSQKWPRMIKGGRMMDHNPFQDESGWLLAAASPFPTAV
jgi:parallel beta-helix repeat protein